jgi:hypothetical protein
MSAVRHLLSWLLGGVDALFFPLVRVLDPRARFFEDGYGEVSQSEDMKLYFLGAMHAYRMPVACRPRLAPTAGVNQLLRRMCVCCLHVVHCAMARLLA